MTITELFEKTYRHHWDQSRFHKSGWSREVKNYFLKNIKDTIGDKDVTKIGPKAIKHWHQGMVNKPTSANRSLEVLSRMFAYAEEEEIIPIGSNPCRAVRAFPERRRGRYATDKELTAIGEVLTKESAIYPREAAFCYLLAFTGARPDSLQKARRENVEHLADGRAVLRFHGKTSYMTGDDDMVILPKFAVDLIKGLPKRYDGLLIGPVNYRRFWEQLRVKAGCPDLWIRDLRRTFASIGLSAGIGIDAIGELLNHRSSQTTKTYAKLLPTARLAASERVATSMSQFLCH